MSVQAIGIIMRSHVLNSFSIGQINVQLTKRPRERSGGHNAAIQKLFFQRYLHIYFSDIYFRSSLIAPN